MTKLQGTMLAPGVSGNGRLYTAELIRKAHDRLVERLGDNEALPVTMLTHHAAGDDSKEIVGHITGVTLDGDKLNYTAELATTDQAKTIENLVKPGANGKPFLKSTSIRGWWLGPVETTNYEGQQVTTAADLEIDGLDFTKNPGVTGASVTIAAESAATETDGRTLISETVEARVEFTETVQEQPVTETKPLYGDPGYRDDKIRRLPIGDRAAAETSWTRIQTPAVAEEYTPNQLKRIKGRIKESLRKHGVDMTETTGTDLAEIAEHDIRLSDVTECYDCYDAPGTAGFSIAAYNGPLTVTVSAYDGIDPKDLAGVATAAMQAAIDAVHAMDPDDDGDVDTGVTDAPADEAGSTNPDDQMESATKKEATVAETKADEATTESTGDKPITQADLNAAVETAVKAALEAAGKTPAEESQTEGEKADEAAPTAEPVDEAKLRAEITADLVKEMRESGALGRKGIVAAKLSESGEPTKPVHEMNDEEFAAYRNELLNSAMPIGEH